MSPFSPAIVWTAYTVVAPGEPGAAVYLANWYWPASGARTKMKPPAGTLSVHSWLAAVTPPVVVVVGAW